MNTQKHRWILYLIVITIITTITVQAYWNYKNYKENKRLVTNEIQLSLDNAIEEYYAKIAVPCYLNLIVKRLGNSYYKTFQSLIFDFDLI